MVSDADMCDAVGAEGILRTHAYNLSKRSPFFNKNLLPIKSNLSAIEYATTTSSHSVQHFFDKLFKLSSIMMTAPGRKEAERRQQTMVDFLRELFREDNATEWSEYLEDYLQLSEVG